MNNFFEMFGRFMWVAMWLLALFVGWASLQFVHLQNLKVLQAFMIDGPQSKIHANGLLLLVAVAWTVVCSACSVLAVAEDGKK